MRRAACAALACAALLAAPDARASDGGVFLIVLGIAVTDIAYVTIDSVYAASPERPPHEIAIVEAGVAAPQAVIGYGLTTFIGANEKASWGDAVSAGITTIPSFMLVHGVWGGTTKHADAGALYGVSWATGADAALTSAVVGRALSGHLGGTTFGVFEMIATAPQIAVATQQAATPSIGSKAGWIALDAWAGALFVHGVASAIAGEVTSPEVPPRVPPVPPNGPLAPDGTTPSRPMQDGPPPPRPDGSPEVPSGPLAPDPPPSGLVVPGSTMLAPMPVAGGGGIAIVGALF
ncbi:MAG TPA: hypothetical protein VIF62_24455 [Labilithrix sp.]|jgi:hypothetical protein